MKVVPAIDLREGACVQLVGGSYQAERVRLDDPLVALERWRAAGFSSVHVVDLDAALGKGDNRPVIARLTRSAPSVAFTVGGGVRDEATIQALLDLGAREVIVGTRALEDAAWLARVAERFDRRLVVAADVRHDEVVTRGWTQGTGRRLAEVLVALEPLPLAAILVTAVHVEGQLRGPDVPLFQRSSSLTRHPLIASGGITTLADVRALAAAGASRAVIGMALYTGAIDPIALAREFP